MTSAPITDPRVLDELARITVERCGLGYVASSGAFDIQFEVDGLRRTRGELHAELAIRGDSGLLGAGTFHLATINLSSTASRKALAAALAERTNGRFPVVPWRELVERVAVTILTAERTGEPAILLRDLPRPEPGDSIEVEAGVRLLARHPVIVFGDGGGAKSYLGLYWAGRLALAGRRVLFADWEAGGEDHRDRLERLFGADMPEVRYLRCERPMVAEADRLARIVREETIDYLIADSIAFACDGAAEEAEVAIGYFRAVRPFRIGSLHIAHTTKADDGDQKPFGSTFWHNSARATWYVKRSGDSPDGRRITIGLFNRKANLGPLAPAIGYAIDFGDERTTFQRVELADVADLAERLPLRQRMAHLLRGGSMTMAQIALELEVPIDSVVKTTKRNEGKVFTRVPGPDGVFRIGLLERERELP